MPSGRGSVESFTHCLTTVNDVVGMMVFVMVAWPFTKLTALSTEGASEV